jgi:hypothetical protein
MVTTSGSLSPRIRLYSPAGMLLNDAANRNYYGGCSGGSVTELNTVQLTASGTYTVLVGDCGDTSAGSYVIYTQRTNNPSGAAILPFGQTQTGGVSSAAQDNSYTFTANANDVIDFTMVTTSGSLSPRIRLYSSAGVLLKDAANRNYYGGCSGGSVTELNTVQLTASGTYTVLLGDCGDTSPGNYTIYAQRTNNAFSPVPLAWGGITQAGSVISVAQSNTYTFTGAASNTVDLTMVTTTGALSPRIRLYNPDGTLLSEAANRNYYGGCSGGSTVHMNSVGLAQKGIYTVLVQDCGDTNIGNYNLSGQCFGGCPQVQPAITWPTPSPINVGTPLSATQLNASSPVVGVFTYTPPTGTVLPIGPQNLSVNLTPTDTVDYTPATDSVQIMVNNTAAAKLTPATLSFPNQAVNSTSAARSVTLTNIGPVPLSIGDISANGYFSISSTTCGATLAAGKTCAVNVTFTPLLVGATTGLLLVGDSALTSPQFVVLKGTGVVPELLTPTSAVYGSQAVGTTSTPKTFTLVNNLSVAATGIVISTTGDFAVSATTCTTMLAAKGSCTISVTFSPTVTGARTGQLSVSSSSPNSPQTAALSGTGVVPATVTPASANYSTQAVGTTSAAKTFTLTNNLAVALDSIVVTMTGDFAVAATTCTTTLAAKSTCTISVTFTPTVTGGRTGQLSVSSSAPNSPQTAGLSGTGVVPATLNPASASYAAQTVGTTSAAKTFTLTNNLSIALANITIATTGDFAISATTCGTSLASKGACTISVTFTPTVTGVRTGQLSVSDSASNSPQTSSLTGSGK